MENGPAWEKSWVKLPGCGSNGVWLLIIVSLLATSCLAHGRCSTNICEPNERRASTVKEKALYENRGRGGHLHQGPTSRHPYMHCASHLYNSAPFTKERMRPKEAKPRVLDTVPPPSKIARWSFTVTLISRLPSPGLVLTAFRDSSPISLSLVTQMQ